MSLPLPPSTAPLWNIKDFSTFLMNSIVPPQPALHSRISIGTSQLAFAVEPLKKFSFHCTLILDLFSVSRLELSYTILSNRLLITSDKLETKIYGGSTRRVYLPICVWHPNRVVVGPPWKRRPSPRWGTCWRQRRGIRLRFHLIHQHRILHQLQLHLISWYFCFSSM